jgi:chorismate mutase
MNFQILNVILYPKNKELKPRFLTFKEGKINIITGTSQKGKSAIISIIDYCLGSGECNIPIGLIRDTTEVFAIYVKINNEFFFFGRENFDDHKSKMYFYKEESNSDKKIELRSNKWLRNKEDYSINTSYFKSFMNDIAGFKNIETGDNQSSFDYAASFRDTAAFQFQTQNIIANPTTMFYKTDSWEHLQKLKTIFPLILGYKSYEIIDLEGEINELERVKNRKVTTFEQIKAQYENWQANVYKYYTQAISLGLTISDINIQNSTVDEIKNELVSIVKRVNSGELYKNGSINRFSEKVIELSNDRNSKVRVLEDLKFKYNKIVQLDNSRASYVDDVAREKEQRLQPIEWFLQRKGNDTCPFCGENSKKAVNELIYLNEEKQKNLEVLKKAKSNELSFEKEKAFLKLEINQNEIAISDIDENLHLLLSKEKEENDSLQKIYEFSGKIEHVIDNLNKISPSSELFLEIKKLEEHIATEKLKLDGMYKKFNKKASLEKLSNIISEYSKLLPIEDKYNRIVHFDPTESLNIKIEDIKTKNKYFLSRIGSGANYMGYHLATLFGIHEYLNSLNNSGKINYIPTFLILDQPSQVYYPKEFTEGSKDIADTKKIFETAYEFMKRTNNQIQIIILEHVPTSMWENINTDSFYLVEKWDKDLDALIPEEWY